MCRLLMQCFASLVQHRAIRHLLRQRMLKEVFDFWERWLLEKLFSL